MFNSLVQLETTRTQELDLTVIADLNIEQTYARLIDMTRGQGSIIDRICLDEETIRYRQDMMKDFLRLPGLLTELHDHLCRFDQFRFQFEKEMYKSSRLYYLIELLLIVEASVLCLEDLSQTLKYYDIKADGLVRLREAVIQMTQTPDYKQMKQDMKEIRYIFKQIKSVEVAINLNTGMRPYEAQITSINLEAYRYPKAFRKVSDALERTEIFLGHRTRHYVPIFPVEKVNLDLLEEIEFALKDHKGAIKQFLIQYNKIDATPFITLHEEVTFYLASFDLAKTLTDHGLWLTWPEVVAKEEKILAVQGGYNLHLGKRLIKNQEVATLVANDFTLGQEKGVVVLTGSNRGGKTTFTQMIGQIQVLTQLGLPVPAKAARVSIVDKVVTHFPKLEKESVDYGRFGKACMEFSQAYKEMTHYSLLLMNESFSGTSHLESLEIASEVVRALCHLKVRTIYNTHLHELIHELDNSNGACSYVVGDLQSPEAYKVYEADPRGFSQAMEIARKFGVTYDQLLAVLEGGKDDEKSLSQSLMAK